MKLLTVITLLFLISTGNIMPQNFNLQNLYDSYSTYKNNSFTKARFKHKDVLKNIKELKSKKLFKIKMLGKSLEGREINLISIGKGKINVLLWSQMHGDEPTATMALFDLFNFFSADDEFNGFRKELFSKLTLHFIPMLNPDGAEKFKRRNALNIDLNRDAIRLQCPESKILKGIRDSLKPKFGFNLHDQNTRYSAGNSFRSATISFLAPAFNYEKEINEVRGNTMKLIVKLNEALSNFIPGHIAKYNDDFEPRAFGDNFIKWGTSSVLIESGGWKNDAEKQYIRKLNFIALLAGFNAIIKESYKQATIEEYKQIPTNDNLLFDLLLRKLTVKYKNQKYKIDIGINKNQETTADYKDYYNIGKIEDWGDLSIFYGYKEYELEGYEIKNSKIYKLNDKKLEEIDAQELLNKGYGFIELDTNRFADEYTKLPLNIIFKGANPNLNVDYLNFANFTIWKNNKLMFNVVNGCIHDVTSDSCKSKNGLIFKP